MSAGHLSTVNGPPPGLSMPPGLGVPMGMSGAGINGPMSPSTMNGHFAHQGLGIGAPGMQGMRPMPMAGPINATLGSPSVGGIYPDYMMGR